MTRVEREALQALAWPGQRRWHILRAVTNVRLKARHIDSTPSTSGRREKWLSSLVHRGLAESKYHRTGSVTSLVFFTGTFYKISKEGQKLAKGRLV